jgi:hypothetical protein
MIRTYEAAPGPREPVDPTKKLPIGPTPRHDPEGREFVAEWLRHLEAGRVGGNPPMSEETRAAILANERVLRGR